MLNDVVPSDLHLSVFADDHSVRKEFKPNDRGAELQTKKEVEECMVNVRPWMDQVRLQLNSAKTEFIYFGSRIQLSKCVVTHLNVNCELVESHTNKVPQSLVRSSTLIQGTHNKKCQTAMINYLLIRKFTIYLQIVLVRLSVKYMCIPLGLCKCSLIWTTGNNHRQISENSGTCVHD